MTDTLPADKPTKRVPFPAREEDGCTHCGTVLVILDKHGALDVQASEAAQQAHHAKACLANPASEYTEYEPAWK